MRSCSSCFLSCPCGRQCRPVCARRWRHLWKAMPALRITWDTEDDFLSEEDVEDMNRFVDHLMFHRYRESHLDSFEFRTSEFGWEGPLPHINLWIKQALLSQVSILSVEVDGMNFGFWIDDTPLIYKHLTKLKLENVELKGEFLDFSSCPTLKSLSMRRCDIVAEKISSQSLEHLTIIETTFGLSIQRTRIYAPSLVWLQLTDNTKTPVLESMPSLVKAFVRLHDTLESNDRCDKEKYGGFCLRNSCNNCGVNINKSQDCMLLKGFSQAESLELVAEPGSFIFKRI